MPPLPLLNDLTWGFAGPAPVTEPSQSNISNGTAELLCLISVLFIVGVIILASRRRRWQSKRGADLEPVTSQNPPDSWAAIPTSQMENDASSALVAADDALKTSDQELTFATAQYGAEATAEFFGALARSRADVMEAFRLRQMLDDDVSDDEATKRDWYRQIIERCRTAESRLDAQVDSFDQLRDMKSRLEPMIEALTARREAVMGRLPQADANYNNLVDSYAPSALLPVSNSASQLAERIMFADRSLASARASVASGKRSEAALGVRAAEEALGQVDILLDGVETFSSHLEQASASTPATLSEVEADITSGKAAVAAADGGSTSNSADAVDLAAAVAGAEQVTQAVRAHMAAQDATVGVPTSKPDPFSAMRSLEHVDERLSAALSNIRDGASRSERARTMLEAALPAARAEVDAASNFVTTRRGAIGTQARTRLAEAQRHLDQAVAMAETDPVAALNAAQQAESMASQSSHLANQDVDGWSQSQIGGGVMGGFGGAVLGGILIDSVRGGLRTGFGWGAMTPGSFGGHRTRARLRV